MIPTGTITRLEGEYACVLLVRQSACQSCRACSLGQSENKQLEVRALNKVNATLGDIVELDLKGNSGLKAALLTYAVPLPTLFLGYLLLERIFMFLGPEMAQGIGAFGSIILSFLSFGLLRLLEPRFKTSANLIPTIKRKVN